MLLYLITLRQYYSCISLIDQSFSSAEQRMTDQSFFLRMKGKSLTYPQSWK